ncbi:hypothetical protein [Nocardioides perillae]|uniref:TspO and MBR related proteins n=1 Tax=Nocardioides perillae TaxID=1119534 RepID=A0A7Y9UJH3_9ACTN|nr:hypothetical protein [Nocardioides perillae]NYG54238.1 hypothetical protein [Nocardioides perillae]
MAEPWTGPVPLVGRPERTRTRRRAARDLDPITAHVVARAAGRELAVRRRDRVRQVALSLAWAVAAAVSVVVAGTLGSPVLEGAGGALAPGASSLAPTPLTAAVGLPLALGLTAYVGWQWLPGRTGATRHRRTGWWAASALVLHAAWWVSVAGGSVAAGGAVLLALAAVLLGLVGALHRTPTRGRLERFLVDGTLGAWLGWVLLAALAHVTAAVADAGLAADPVLEPALALVALATLVALGRLVAVEVGAPWPFAVGLAWSLVGVAAGRLLGPTEPGGWLVGLAALAAAGAVLLATATERPTPPALT